MHGPVNISRTRMAVGVLAALAMLVTASLPIAAAEQPVGMLLTWQRDPTTTMTIDWQTEASDENPNTELRYRKAGQEQWQAVRARQSFNFPFSDRAVHRIELTQLEPDSEYEFQMGDFERTFKFRTMPTDLSKPLVFATGGDTRHQQDHMERTNRAAMAYDPDFVVWGGDFAYADARADRLDRWYEWFDANMNTLITEDGRVVPIIAAIGNHEVRSGYHHRHDAYQQTDAWRKRIAPYFYELFAFPGQPGYNVLDFGNYLSIVVLDTDHTNPIGGQQTRWLDATLRQRQNIPHVIPVYHVPAYPSHRNFDGSTENRVRQSWTPLFDRYGVRLAFENHDHAYKRTIPIRGGEAHPAGVVYMGDGAWGVNTREVHPERWYLERAESIRHAIIVTLHGTHQHVLVVSDEGEIIDEYPQTPQRRDE